MTHYEKIEFLRNIQGETISPRQMAAVFGGEPYQYNIDAKNGRLTVPFIWHGNHLRIFKEPLISILEGHLV